jgi:hypothetical protein
MSKTFLFVSLFCSTFAQIGSVVALDTSTAAPSSHRPIFSKAQQIAACDPGWKRHCSSVCNGDYGYFCFFGTVCNPNTHRCEKTSQ